ncbi:chitinase C-terminal domain-containing protein [Dactylosporangium sp. CA-152071]|uniref:chitinase C-terminal domain-containing protein n=1 Tax=Dactylosporangium sp. CA-152071 TaxID=3239933 RepID=UPI003D8DC27D
MRRRTLHLLSAATAALVAASAAFFVTTANAEVDHAACRPDGLYPTAGVTVPYCKVYDTNGRENLGADHGRRIIGYFTSWRTGKNGAPAYLASNIPWDKITHINYAFAHVDGANKISVGTPTAANNAATNMTWPGVAGAEMDPAYSYTGHFNLLNKFKKQHPAVKTLISVGGWAETGGFFNDNGDRVDSGGFYRMTTNADNSINTAGINTFADSVVTFLRTYGFDGVDIDYEYPTSNAKAGNPLDFAQADAKRAGLNASYHLLMKTLREKLDAAAAADGKYYMVTVAAPASGWLLRGLESYQALQYLDYVNIMSYDLHGSWNHFVGPNAALYDNGDDAELSQGGVYGAYSNIGYLNTDWAYHYFRGAMQSGRINIGVPYYTRGWRGVTGGTNGLWGRAALPDQTKCPAGTGGAIGSTTPCGNGAVGIDNLWHDEELNAEVPAGANPMWHAKNLQEGRAGDYLEAYGLTPATDPEDRITGTYTRNYSSALVAPWLWNAQKQVFLSTEDDQSLGTKADYVVNKGIGGVMIWELAGDYAWDAARNEWYMGNTLTNLLYDKFKTAAPYGAKKANITLPTQTLNVGVQMGGFALGDNNYPINPELRLINNTGAAIPAGSQLEFDYPTTAPGNLGQQSGWALTTVSTGHTGSNVGGLKGDFHRVRLNVPAIAAGSYAEVTLNYQLPISGPSNFTLTIGGQTYALAADYGHGGTAPTVSPTVSGNPSTGTCTAPPWAAGTVYTGGNLVSHNGHTWKAQWWTQGDTPGTNAVWVDQGVCSGTSPTASPSASKSPSTSPSTSPSASTSPSRSPSTSPSTSTGTGCAGLPVWNAGTAYSGNTVVQYSGRKYRAKWWTQGENPTTTGQWGVWEDQGAC